jgi:membrane-bound ClpP family serine protease
MRLTRYDPNNKGADPLWDHHGLIDRGSDPFLKITAPLAQEWRLALTTDIDSDAKLYEYYGLTPQRVRLVGDSWLDRVAEFFRDPTVRFILIMLGIVGLILEFKMPGTTIPGVLAAICFVLFFWASSFVGEFTLLAVLLFVLGLILIGMEIFVLPGTAFPAIAGIVLLLTSLVLVTLRQIPQTTGDWLNLGTTVGTYGMSLVAAMALVFVIAYFLPSIPYANRMVLKPPSDDGEGESVHPLSPSYAGFLGAIGVAVTTLRPAGKAQFGDDFLDVIAEGDYVNPGARVQVIEIEGNRIVVKEM